MAKDATPTPGADPVAEFDEFTPEQTKGKFDDIVQAMIYRDKTIEEKEPDEFKKGKRTRYRYLATKDDAEKTVRQFQDSARKFERTGRHIGSEDQGDGVGVLLLFVLGVRQSRPRKSKTVTEQVADTSDVPQEVTDETEADDSTARELSDEVHAQVEQTADAA